LGFLILTQIPLYLSIFSDFRIIDLREKHKIRKLSLRGVNPAFRAIKLSGAGQAGRGGYCDSSVSIGIDRSNGEMAV